MTLLYDRKYSLKVGLPPYAKEISLPSDPLKDGTTTSFFPSNEDFRVEYIKRAVEITDLQMQCDIKSTSANSSNTSQTIISLYNLHPSTLDIIAQANNYVILEAGYAEDLQLEMIFTGQVETHNTTKKGQDVVTELTCSDAYTPNNYVKISKKFTRDQTYGDVLTYLADQYKANGITTGDLVKDWADIDYREPVFPDLVDGLILSPFAVPQDYSQLPPLLTKPANLKMPRGMVLTGFLHQALDRVCAQLGYVSYITNGRLFIHPKGYTRMVEQFELSTSIMKSIRPMGSKSGGGSLGKGIDGISITTFLDGRLDIDKTIKVLDGKYAGEYKIITKEHKLDYEGSAWNTLLTCTKFD